MYRRSDAMEVLWNIGELAIGMLIFYHLLSLLGYLKQRHIVPNKYEWLTLLHHHDWVILNTLHERMQRKKKTNVPLRGLRDADFREFSDEKLIRSREVPGYVYRIGNRGYPVFEVQLTMKGAREKNKYLNSEPRDNDIDDDDDPDGRLIPV